MRILYAVNCEDADGRQDGRIDIRGAFHHLFAPGFPAKQDNYVLAMAVEWEKEGAGRQEFGLDLLDPSESPVFTIRGHTDVTPSSPRQPPPRTLFIFPLPDVVFPTPGTYLFRLQIAGETHLVAPLHLIEDPDVVG